MGVMGQYRCWKVTMSLVCRSEPFPQPPGLPLAQVPDRSCIQGKECEAQRRVKSDRRSLSKAWVKGVTGRDNGEQGKEGERERGAKGGKRRQKEPSRWSCRGEMKECAVFNEVKPKLASQGPCSARGTNAQLKRSAKGLGRSTWQGSSCRNTIHSSCILSLFAVKAGRGVGCWLMRTRALESRGSPPSVRPSIAVEQTIYSVHSIHVHRCSTVSTSSYPAQHFVTGAHPKSRRAPVGDDRRNLLVSTKVLARLRIMMALKRTPRRLVR
ncbi:uncharacterized protein EI97DRAFT_43037 [Westerdykella ornata]|uniref:Uncharacterized protein n=1 Tax=Westerdykella ornata TaxID=318751 RepID=A0A6A6JIW3_WESOR|nr:uncharacterized protein EI97DRAFT_43037 [Westerdykella ornata]KAF2276521.1 hypothetical protein EI97DRAFT_43037 [Westerdykella ornata]